MKKISNKDNLDTKMCLFPVTTCSTFLKKGKKQGVKYRRNLKYLEKINVLN